MNWLRRFIVYAKPYRWRIVLVVFLTLLISGLTALAPWPLKIIVDNAINENPLPDILSGLAVLGEPSSPTKLLAWAALATLIIFTGRFLLQALRGYIQTGTATRMKFDLAAESFTHLQCLSLGYFNKNKTGDLVKRINTDSVCASQIIGGLFLPMLTSVITLIIMFTLLLVLDASLALLSLLAVIPLPVLMRLMTQGMTAVTYEQYQTQGELSSLAEQAMSALPLIQAFGREKQEDKRFRGISNRAIQTYLNMIAAQMRFKFGVEFVTALGTALLMIMGGLHVAEGVLTVGGLLVFLSYLAAMYMPLQTLAYLSMTYADAGAHGQRVIDVLDSTERIAEPEGKQAKVLENINHGIRIRLEKISFGYDKDRPPILENITLEVGPGETLALVGATGSGKSTLASLIPRFYDPWTGTVLINGIDARDIPTQNLRGQISLVLQEPFLFPLSIARNIAYGRPEAELEEIMAAAVAAEADEFIRRLPDGYETQIGERGLTLSGGQRQRLAIARAFLKDAPVIILDEPTAALDAETEASVMNAFNKLTWNKTSLIIAHRLSTIRDADQIAVLDKGRIVEIGTHAELLRSDGIYRGYHEMGRVPTS